MARAFLDAFKGYFKNMLRCDLAHGAKPLQRIFAHPGGNFTKFGIAQPRIGFGEGHERRAIPYSKGEISIEVGPPPMSGLSIDHHAVNGARI